MVAESPIIVMIHRLLFDLDVDLSEVSGPGATLTANASTTMKVGGADLSDLLAAALVTLTAPETSFGHHQIHVRSPGSIHMD